MSNPTRTRRGLTIVEVLVALILIAVGLLGMAGATALALRVTLDAGKRRDAVHRVSGRLAQLEAAGCANATTGSSTTPALHRTERWTVRRDTSGRARVADSLTWLSARGEILTSARAAFPC